MKYDFSIAAAAVLMLLFCHSILTGDRGSKSAKVFSALALTALLTAITEVICQSFTYGVLACPAAAANVVYTLHVFCYTLISPLALLFFILSLRDDYTPKGILRIIILLPAVSFALIATNPLTKLVFAYNAIDRSFARDWGAYIIYGISSLCYFSLVGVFISDRKTVSKGQVLSAVLFGSISLCILCLDMAFDSINYRSILLALAVLSLYLLLRMPMHYMERNDAYTKEGFSKKLSSLTSHDARFHVLGIQVNGISAVKEAVGSESRDIVVAELMEFLHSVMPDGKLYRLGGSRFSAIIKNSDVSPLSIIEKIDERFMRPFQGVNAEFPLTTRMCLLCCPDTVATTEEIFDLMEYSLRPPSTGENSGLVKVDEVLIERNKRENDIEQIVMQAVLNEAFQVYYQPIHSQEKDKFTSAEALVRLFDEQYGFISPEEFIPQAEKNGVILKIGQIVFTKVCSFIAENDPRQYGVEYIEVNLSVVQCMQVCLHDQLTAIMQQYGVPSDMINLEITETAAVHSSEMLLNNMRKLIDKGLTFALDDYGTGFSNTSHIIEYPFRLIKLDKSIVWAAMKSDKAMKTLKHTVAMIKDLNMKIVAEGVENSRQAQILSDMGCDYFQGFHYARPMPEKDFIRLIRREHESSS